MTRTIGDGATQLSENVKDKTLLGYATALGGLYGAYRTAIKSVTKYTEGRNARNTLGEVVA